MADRAPAVGVLSFTAELKRSGLDDLERRNRRLHQELVTYLESQGMTIVDPAASMVGEGSFGVHTQDQVSAAARILRDQGAEAVVLGLWNWTDCILAKHLASELPLPLALFTEDDIRFAGHVAIAAVGATLWQCPPNEYALRHFRTVDKEELVTWLRGVTSLSKLRSGSILMWGGSYCLKMEHLEDDFTTLKLQWVKDILVESEYYLIKRSEQIRECQGERISRFVTWLRDGGAQITFDDEMFDASILRTQVSMYLAAKDRLAELEGEHIIGVSIRDQPELSMEYGVTSCLLPAFLPFPVDAEGSKEIVPTVCEGDVKGLITCALLGYIRPDVPPLFGDLRIGPDYVLISNCGGASVFYAARSNEPAEVLPRITLRGQCQGASGGAIGFLGERGPITMARLTRIGRDYFMQLGFGEAMPYPREKANEYHIGPMWPFTAIDLGVDPKEVLKTVGSNHFSAMIGNVVEEVGYACQQVGIPVVRLDSIEDMRAFRRSM